MRVPNNLRKLAAVAFTIGQSWSDFQDEHAELIHEAEPYSAARYYRLRQMLMHVVVTGSTSDMFGIGDRADADAEWFADDQDDDHNHARFGMQPQGTFFDVSDAYEYGSARS